MKTKNDRIVKADYFKFLQFYVKKILTEKDIDVDYTDDDAMFDFLYDAYEHPEKYNFDFGEWGTLLSYNNILQLFAFTPYPIYLQSIYKFDNEHLVELHKEFFTEKNCLWKNTDSYKIS